MEPVSAYYRTALNYCTYRLSDRSQKYEDDVANRAANMARNIDVQLK